jgi:anti-anti-sigma factor
LYLFTGKNELVIRFLILPGIVIETKTFYMNLTIEKIDNFSILKIEGRIDTTNASLLEAEIDKIYNSGERDVILDCSELKYISSSGLRVFLIAQKRANALKGKLHISNMQPAIREIFDISGFSNIFRIFDSLQEALEK